MSSNVLKKLFRQNPLKGGKGDRLRYSDVNPRQLQMGLDVEKEHSKDPAIAMDAVKDHMAEFPNYYTALKKMEKKLEAQKIRKKTQQLKRGRK